MFKKNYETIKILEKNIFLSKNSIFMKKWRTYEKQKYFNQAINILIK